MASLTPKQLHAASLIASGQSQRQAAKTVGVSPQTRCGWARLPAFTAYVQGLLSTVHEETALSLTAHRLRAVEVLAHLMESGPPATRLQAVRLVLEATGTPTPPADDGQHFHAVLALLQGIKP